MEFDLLRYADETDKSYGLAGMALSLVAWDVEDWLEGINIDAEPDEAMEMTREFYLCISPRTGAKAAWEQALRRFQITAAMTVANVSCRQMAHHHHGALAGKIDAQLREALSTEGAAMCELDSDEVSRIYGKSLAYCSRLFSHPGVCRIIDALAESLRQNRKLPADKIFEILAPLNRL